MSDARLERYKALLLAWNEKINLIGPEAQRNLDAHIQEAVAAAALLRPEEEVLDFGSGGGLPGIPMAIHSPAAHFHFVEADQKKWVFLKRALRECGLEGRVWGDRLERVLPQLTPSFRFSLVISRAVGRAEQWLPSLRPHLAPGARVALFQSEPQPPPVEGFTPVGAERLPRGESNWLSLLAFHVEQP